MMDLENDDTDADYVPDKDELQQNNKQSRRYSIVWSHYERVDNFGAVCNYCSKTLSYRTTVTNLKKHLQYKHPEVLDDTLEKKHNVLNDNEFGQKPRKISFVGHKRSEIWKYFRVSKDDSTRARCKMCNQDVACTNSSNLKYHLMKQHSKIDGNNFETSDEEEEGKNPTFKAMKRRKRSEGWKYFEIKDPENKIANCKICRRDISYCTVSNLMKHIMRKHGRTEFNTTVSSDNEETDLSKREPLNSKCKPQKRFRSTIWKYFTVQDAVSKLAQCKLCKRDFAYATLSNLRKHFLRKHQDVKIDPSTDDEGEPEAEEMIEIDTSSPIWAYFRCLDETLRIASCLICKKRVNYNNDSDLKRHLNRKHPGVDLDGLRDRTKKLMITGNGDIYEVDDVVAKQEPLTNQEDNDNDSDDWPNHNDEVNTLHSTEYLDEHAFDEPEYSPPKKRRKHPSYKQQTTEEESSLDIFGRYMISLLKKLPKHKSDRLQVDFIRQIMEAQLADDRNNSYQSQVQNTRYLSSDDTRVSSNSEVQRFITRDGEIQHLVRGNEQIIVTNVGDEVTVRTE